MAHPVLQFFKDFLIFTNFRRVTDNSFYFSTCFPDALVIATDINPAACQATKITSSRNNNKKLQVVLSHFLPSIIFITNKDDNIHKKQSKKTWMWNTQVCSLKMGMFIKNHRYSFNSYLVNLISPIVLQTDGRTKWIVKQLC